MFECPICQRTFGGKWPLAWHTWKKHLVKVSKRSKSCFCGRLAFRAATAFYDHCEEQGGIFTHYLAHQLGVKPNDCERPG